MAKFKTDKPVWILVIKAPTHRVIVSKLAEVCIGLVIDELSKGTRMKQLELVTFSFEGPNFIIQQQTNELILEMSAKMGLLRPTHRPLDPEIAFEAQSGS